MKEIILQGNMLVDAESAHSYLAEELDFPEYYGRNLDALYDCLTDLRDIKIKIEVNGNENAYLIHILQVFEDASEENDDIEVYII